MTTLISRVEASSDDAAAHVTEVSSVDDVRRGGWTFLSNHGHVFLTIAADPEVRLRDIAVRVGITERAVQLIVADLVAGGYIVREKVGRRNRYDIINGRKFRHPAEQFAPLDEFLAIFYDSKSV